MFKKIIFLLTPKERKEAIFLLAMILIMALLDTIGVASILPFMAVLTNPEIINSNILLNNIYKFSNIIGVDSEKKFLFFLGVFVFVILVFSLIFKTYITYAQVRFIQLREYTISKRLMENYLFQPYSWFLSRNSADIGKTILSEVAQVIQQGIRPLIEVIAKGMVSITLIILLVYIDTKLAVIVGLSLGTSYGIIFYFLRNFLNKIGEQRLQNNRLRFTYISEAFGASKEIKVGGLEKKYINKFSYPAENFALTSAYSQMISQLPRFLLEAIAFGGIILVMLYLMSQTGNFNNALPVISVYVFAGYRLLPALQQVYASLTQLTFVSPSLDKLYGSIKNLKTLEPNQNQSNILFNKKITLKNVYYNYPNTSRTALKNISLNIYPKTTVGLVGSTGSGKTTTVDIILGLLEAQKGILEVDGKIITKENSREWQRLIGYVPQHIYLSDDTIAANIAFGENPKTINMETVKKVCHISNLHEFVTNELPNQYLTIVGERGIRLSGGQRQRIGIARALYHDPQILILDEATSSLDSLTEQSVMDAVNNLGKDITIILIAHRLNTVKNCDNIFKFERGELVGEGTFEELLSNNGNFIKPTL